MTKVRVGIVSWNTAELLDRCLTALPAALEGVEAEVVVVDNASADASADVAACHDVHVIRNDRNVGYARAMNEALDAPDAEVLIALNPDTEPPPCSLATLVDRLLAAPDIGLVGPRLVNADGTLQHSAYRFPSPSVAFAVCFIPRSLQRRGIGERLRLEGFTPHDRADDVDWFIGAVHVIRRAALAQWPPYSERWFMYVEDLDLCWRLSTGGWRRRLEGDVVVPHVGNAAGEQAWGGDRTARWLAATYDWYALAKGGVRARGWALVNTAGVLYLLTLAVVRGARRDVEAHRRRALAKELVRALPMHARALVFGGGSLPALAGFSDPVRTPRRQLDRGLLRGGRRAGSS